jgi:23S rRNA (cytosine1962-C5)-methyltransferase
VRDSSYRVVFSEADRLPGLIIDRYGDLLTLQCNTWGIERLKREIIEVLQEIFHPVAIIVRNGGEFRREMGLPTEDERLIFGKKVDVTNYEVNLVGLSLGVDFTTAQKTGLYLDQVHSYRTVAGMDFSGLTGMDLFCYSGIFGMLSLKHGADRVTFVDSSGAALSRLAENLRRNGISKERYDIVRSDVPSYLSDCVPESRGFLFLDPPKFIQSRKSYYKGLQGYFNLNRAAVRSLRDGGFLFTFSCSHHAGEEVFRRKVVDAMQKEACTAREYYHFRQNADHAVLLPMEESFYLKGFLFGIDRRKEETNDAMGVS